MESHDPYKPASTSFRRGAILTISVLWTLIVIQFSARQGRLSMDAGYDDCIYMFDGWSRLMSFDRGGITALFKSLVNAFPHAPGTTFQAMAGFVLFGIHDYAPYVLNLLPILIWLTVVSSFGRHLRRRDLILLLLAALSFQISFVVVHELRPDPTYAILLMAAVGLGLQREQEDQARKYAWLSPILFALALYMKPTFFLNSLFLFGCFWMWLVVGTYLGHRKSENASARIWRAVRINLPPLAIFTVLAVPLFIINFGYFWDYLIRNAYGEETNIWKIKGGPLAAVHYFTVGWGGRKMLGTGFYTAVAFLLFGLTGLLLLRRHRARKLCLSLTAFALLGLFVMAVGQLNTAFFGLTFHFLLVLAALVPVASLLKQNNRWAAFLVEAVLLIAICINFHHYRTWVPTFTGPGGYPVESIVDKDHSLVHRMLDRLEEEILPRKDGKVPVVFVTFVGNISAGTLRWEATKRGLHLRFEAFDRNEPLEMYLERVRQVDYLVTASRDAPELQYYLPTVAHHAAVHEWVAQRNDFEELEAYPTYTSGGYYLFRRRDGGTEAQTKK